MDSIFADVNPIVVFVAAVVAYLFGGLWYSPFGIERLLGGRKEKSEQEKAAYSKDKKAKNAHLWSFVTTLLTSYALTVLLNGVAIQDVGEGLLVGILCWAGFMVPQAVGTALWEKVDKRSVLVNEGYHLAAILIMAAISSIWY